MSQEILATKKIQQYETEKSSQENDFSLSKSHQNWLKCEIIIVSLVNDELNFSFQ